MNEWGPWTSWSMDLLKFAITFAAGAIVTVGFLNRIEAKQTAQRVRCQTIIDAKIAALNDFSKSSLIYCEAAYEAWTELYRWRERELTDAMRQFTGGAHVDLTIALENMKHRFAGYADVISAVDDFEVSTHNLWRIYDDFVDTRLDRLETELSVPQIARSQLEAQRDAFNKSKDEVLETRLVIIRRLEDILFKSDYDELCKEVGKL